MYVSVCVYIYICNYLFSHLKLFNFTCTTEFKPINMALRIFVPYLLSSFLFHHNPHPPSRQARQVVLVMPYLFTSCPFCLACSD